MIHELTHHLTPVRRNTGEEQLFHHLCWLLRVLRGLWL
jgi:hypothetical protein